MRWNTMPSNKWDLEDKKQKDTKKRVIDFLGSQGLTSQEEFFLDDLSPTKLKKYIEEESTSKNFKTPFGDYDYNTMLRKAEQVMDYAEKNNLNFQTALKGTTDKKVKWTRGLMEIFASFPIDVAIKAAPDSWIEDAQNKILASRIGSYLGDYYNSFDVPAGQEIQEGFKEISNIIGEDNTKKAFITLQQMLYNTTQIVDKIGTSVGADKLGLNSDDKYLKLHTVEENANDIGQTGIDALNKEIAYNIGDISKLGGGGVSKQQFQLMSKDLWNYLKPKKEGE